MGKKRAEARTVTHLSLQNWRNFQSVDVDLQRRVFLIGPNASGKSNFLDALRFLHDIVSPGGGFQEAVLKRRGVSVIRCLAARRHPDVSVAVRIGTAENPDEWQYTLAFGQDNQRRPIIKRETVFQGGKRLLARPDANDVEDNARLTQTHLEQVNVNRAFREVADFLASIRYLHIVPQLVREPDRSVGLKDDPFGGDFLEQVARESQRTQDAWLRRITSALQVAVPQLQDLELNRDDRGTPHLRGKYQHWRAPGAWQTEAEFSDGTLRLLGLLWAILERRGPLLLEEPELSLHPEVVRHIPQMFHRAQSRTGRQVLVSTHSPELLQDDGIGLDEVLLLTPHGEGTRVHPASSYGDVRAMVEGGVSLGDAAMPAVRPTDARQLFLFGD